MFAKEKTTIIPPSSTSTTIITTNNNNNKNKTYLFRYVYKMVEEKKHRFLKKDKAKKEI